MKEMFRMVSKTSTTVTRVPVVTEQRVSHLFVKEPCFEQKIVGAFDFQLS